MSDPQSNRLPELQDRFMRVVEATTDVVAMADRAGRLLYLNKAGRQMFGWPLSEPLGERTVQEIHPPWVYELIRQEGLPAALREGRWSGETALLAEGMREVPVLQLILAHTGTEGGVEFFSTICRDISDRKHKELERIEWANRYDAAIRASGQIFFDLFRTRRTGFTNVACSHGPGSDNENNEYCFRPQKILDHSRNERSPRRW